MTDYSELKEDKNKNSNQELFNNKRSEISHERIKLNSNNNNYADKKDNKESFSQNYFDNKNNQYEIEFKNTQNNF